MLEASGVLESFFWIYKCDTITWRVATETPFRIVSHYNEPASFITFTEAQCSFAAVIKFFAKGIRISTSFHEVRTFALINRGSKHPGLPALQHSNYDLTTFLQDMKNSELYGYRRLQFFALHEHRRNFSSRNYAALTLTATVARDRTSPASFPPLTTVNASLRKPQDFRHNYPLHHLSARSSPKHK